MKKLTYHHLSNLLPMMNPAEREALKLDLAEHGQRDPIVLLDGQILDGRNRYELCCELKIEPRLIEYRESWGKPIDYVKSKAMHRNLSDSQKACAAVRFEMEFSKEGKAKRNSKLRRGTKPAEKTEATHTQNEWSSGRAAQLFGIGRRYVEAAKTIFNEDRKLFDAVFNGEEILTRAYRQMHRSRKKKRLATITPPAVDLANCTVDVGDNLKLLPTYSRHLFDLIVADPQYNIGYDYGDGVKADRLSEKEYLGRSRKWIEECVELLTASGSMWVVINHENAASIELIMRESGLHPRAYITWYETFGNNCQENFNRTSRRLLYFTRHESNFTFNREPFTRPSARQIIYNDKRQDHDGKLWDDVWIIPRLVDNARERIPAVPTQLPLALVQPIVEGCSDPGNLVLDPFNGSGTTGEACLLTGRTFKGIDISKKFAELARARWARAAANLEAAGKKEKAA